VHPVDELLAACRRYFRATRRRITFEIALLREVNDTEAHARAVAARLHGMACHVNLIPGNACPDEPFRPSERDRVDGYEEILKAAGIATTVRVARGQSIDAGCGQLRRRGATR
jgi:23S rRNA (adenine2503-C2)-methyltransferase